MKKEVTVQAKTVEEAVRNGADTLPLGTTRRDLLPQLPDPGRQRRQHIHGGTERFPRSGYRRRAAGAEGFLRHSPFLQ